jgi:hypothetical protein
VSSMAEVGLLRFARVALEGAEAVLPAYRTKFSKRTFTQPQLLAVVCLMRYEDWTLRKTEVRRALSTRRVAKHFGLTQGARPYHALPFP